jgi:hypothetical protein
VNHGQDGRATGFQPVNHGQDGRATKGRATEGRATIGTCLYLQRNSIAYD